MARSLSFIRDLHCLSSGKKPSEIVVATRNALASIAVSIR